MTISPRSVLDKTHGPSDSHGAANMIDSSALARVSRSAEAVQGWVEKQNYRGYEPFDGLSSPLRALTFRNLLAERIRGRHDDVLVAEHLTGQNRLFHVVSIGDGSVGQLRNRVEGDDLDVVTVVGGNDGACYGGGGSIPTAAVVTRPKRGLNRGNRVADGIGVSQVDGAVVDVQLRTRQGIGSLQAADGEIAGEI